MMSTRDLITQLSNTTDLNEQENLIGNWIPDKPLADLDQLADALKEQVLTERLKDPTRATMFAQLLITLAELADEPRYRAIGKRMQAFIQLSVFANHKEALELFEEAESIHKILNDELGVALIEMSRIWSLAGIGKLDEALKRGEWAASILEKHGKIKETAGVLNNLAGIYGQRGEDAPTLQLLDRARKIYEQLDQQGQEYLVPIYINRAMLLRNLGQFTASIEENKKAIGLIKKGEMYSLLARANHTLGNTYFMLGLYNEAIYLHDEAQKVYLDEKRERDVLLADLTLCGGLLDLGCYRQALDRCEKIYSLAHLLSPLEKYELKQKEARALLGLRKFAKAQDLLEQAQAGFQEVENNTATLDCQIDLAHLAYLKGQFLIAEDLLHNMAKDVVRPQAQATVSFLAAKTALALNDENQAFEFANHALTVIQEHTMPEVAFQTVHLLGNIAARRSKFKDAFLHFDRAIEHLETTQGNMLSVFRPKYLGTRDAVFADAVKLCLQMGRPEEALRYAEKGKSRTLLDMLTNRVVPQVRALEAQDQPLVDEIHTLREERDRLYRRWEANSLQTPASDSDAQQTIHNNEKRIIDLWQRLQIRNQAYRQEVQLWQPTIASPQPYLDEQTALLEYFVVDGQWVIFLITRDSLVAKQLPVKVSDTQKLQQFLRLNFNSVQRVGENQELTTNAQQLLHELYIQLIEPVAENIASFPNLLIVPHASLHYLPFQALFDGQNYLAQRFNISYFPSSSFLTMPSSPAPKALKRSLVVGHSSGGLLPDAVTEAKFVAEKLDAAILLEETATRKQFISDAVHYDTLYIASHASLRVDNPLFSGLSLEDGRLTLFDLFHLRLNASRVVLSGCNTARTVVAGGDDVQGLVYSFFCAGAEELYATLWKLPDRFDELRQIQIERMLDDSSVELPYHRHPYFWASFSRYGRFSKIS